MNDFRAIKDIISDLKFKSSEFKIDIIQCNSDSDVGVFIADTKSISKRLTSLYRKIDNKDKKATITLITDIIMDYKMLVYHFRTYNNIGSSVKTIVNDLEALIDKLTMSINDYNFSGLANDCKKILSDIRMDIQETIDGIDDIAIASVYNEKLKLHDLLIDRFEVCKTLDDYRNIMNDVKDLEQGYNDFSFDMIPFIGNYNNVVLGYRELNSTISTTTVYIGGLSE